MNVLRTQFVMAVAALACACGLARPAPGQEPTVYEPSPELLALLDKLPAEDPALREELLLLGEDDIRALCDMLVEPGTGDDAQARFALHGLALAVGDPGREEEKQVFVTAVAFALDTDPPPQDEAFLIRLFATVLGEDTFIAGTAARLTDRTVCRDAVKALLTIGGDVVLEEFREALPRAMGHCRIALMNGLATYNDAEMVDEFVKDVKAGKLDYRLAAYHALACSGDPAAREVLREATRADSWYEQSQATDDLLHYASRLTARQQADRAAEIYRDLLVTRRSPSDTHVRCAALYGLINDLGLAAMDDLLAALTDRNVQVRAAAANVAVKLPGTEATQALAAAYPSASATGQIAILDVLARRGDEAGLKTTLSALAARDSAVRCAGIAAAATLGGEKVASPLVSVLRGSDAEVRQAAQKALIRIPGEDATRLIGTVIGGMPTAARVALLEVLAARPPIGDLKPVFAAAQDNEKEVRLAALRTLEALAGEGDVPSVLLEVNRARDEDERAAAGRAASAACLRSLDREGRAEFAAAYMDQQQDVAVRAELLRVLGRVGGEAALTAVLAATRDSDPTILDAAIRAFSDWPDAKPAAHVLSLARQTDDAKHHVLALRAFIRMIDLDEDRSPSETLEMCAAALETARRSDEKRLVLSRIGQVQEAVCLRMLDPFLGDSLLGDEAAAATITVAEALIPGRAQEARAALEKVLGTTPPEAIRLRAEAALKRLEQYEGFVAHWWAAGPYTVADEAGNEILSTEFPPEPGVAGDVEWRRQPPPADPNEAWWVDLHATMRGDNRAGYLLTRVFSPAAQKVRLELGSDDGLKVWLNERLVHENNALRGVSPAADKVDVELVEGWNTLLLKVTNNGGGWAACARFRALDGGELDGVYAELGAKP